jgi:hypothetical protein
MIPSNPVNILKTAVGIGGSALVAPVAIPVLQGLAGIAVVGAGIFAVGTIVMKTAGAIKGIGNPVKSKEESTEQ